MNVPLVTMHCACRDRRLLYWKEAVDRVCLNGMDGVIQSLISRPITPLSVRK